ncbi:4Fe-4S dicluster domain-containing protein [Vibrio tritonius]|uniref:4Fe-4S dicluster domain-containing protein n=2 Tax=Vibrio TaxID=662 RepID=A0ABS7YP40_9VIBR|nr:MULTISPECIES: 4Fe-4S dicluster domain-containing protein [Vibrio]MCA2016025.1 4Fe-4S dicluster domain-containing protein [Vibrio tritonius]WPC74516.1 4Fe-4S dicluster domain-containing protein [Vibrio porteresiae DSM 19223]
MKSFVIADPKKCIGCGTCMAACSDVHKKEGLQSHPRLTVVKHQDATVPVMCRHCEDAPCATVCPVQAITKEDDRVLINETLCVGCTLCAVACPFGAIAFDGSRPVAMANSYDTYIPSTPRSSNPCTSSPQTFGHDILAWEPGVKSIAVKCDLCGFREKGPACAEVCPTDAIVMVTDNEVVDSRSLKREMAAEMSQATKMER